MGTGRLVGCLVPTHHPRCSVGHFGVGERQQVIHMYYASLRFTCAVKDAVERQTLTPCTCSGNPRMQMSVCVHHYVRARSYVCVYECMCVRVCVCKFMCIYMCFDAHMCAHMHVVTITCGCTCVCVCVRACMWGRAYVRMNACIDVCMYICVCA